MLNNLSTATRYHKLGGDEIDEISAANNAKEEQQYSEDGGVELLNNLGHDPIISETSAVIDSAINAQRKDDVDNSKKLKLKVLLKEKTFEVFCADNATVLQLKEEISSQTDIPAIQQRLIFSGRQLKPDEKLLSSFKIICNSPIHLFPLPSAQAIAAPEAKQDSSISRISNTNGAVMSPLFALTSSSSSAIAVQSNNNNNIEGVLPGDNPMHFDQDISQISREVKFWCVILIFLSSFTLFNIFTFVTSRGKFGDTWLQSFVTFLDILCSAGGLWVGRLGMNSALSLTIVDIQRYVKYVTILAGASISMRIIWVLSVIIEVQQEVDEYQRKHSSASLSSPPPTFAPSSSNDDLGSSHNNNLVVMDERTVLSYAIQASIIATICILAWSSCVLRAVRLRNAVQRFTAPNQV